MFRIDELIAALRDPDASVRRDAALVLKGEPRALVPLIEALDDPGRADPSIVRALAEIPDTRVVQAFVRCLGREYEHHHGMYYPASTVGHALRKAGADAVMLAVPHFLSALDDADPRVRAGAADVLGRLGDGRARDALAVRLTGDAEAKVREAAARALNWIGAPGAVEPMIDVLADPEPWVRQFALSYLARFSEAGSKRAIAQLCRLLEHGDLYDRYGAANALGALGDPATVGVLIQALGDPELRVRYHVVRALERIGDLRAVPAICSALDDLRRGDLVEAPVDKHVHERWELPLALTTVEALGRLGDVAAVPVLLRTLASSWASRVGGPWRPIMADAAVSLGRIAPATGEAIAALAEACAHENGEVRHSAAGALRRISRLVVRGERQVGADDRGNLVLVDLLHHARGAVRRAAAAALARAGDDGLAALVSVVRGSSGVAARRIAVLALGRAGASGAIDALVLGSRDADGCVRWRSVRSLAGIDDERAKPALIDALRDELPAVRAAAVDALRRRSSSHADLADLLGPLRQDPDVDVCRAVESALATKRSTWRPAPAPSARSEPS